MDATGPSISARIGLGGSRMPERALARTRRIATAGPLMFLSLLCLSRQAGADGAFGQSSVEFFPEPLPSREALLDPALAGARIVSNNTEIEHAEEDPFARPSHDVRDAVSRRLQSLTDELSAQGRRSSALIDDLAALAGLYQELGDHFPAIGALDWALELRRIHSGLYSLEQTALLEQMIASRTALGDYGGAAPLEERLLDLAYRNLDDPRVTLILAASADRRLRETYRILEEGESEQLSFSVRLPHDPAPTALSAMRRREARTSLWSARRQYADAIALAVRNGGYAVLDLLELEERLLSTFFLEISHAELSPPSEANEWLCVSGEEVLKTSLVNVSQFRRSPVAAASTRIKLADWRLLCSRNGRALDTYESAYETLLGEGAPADTMAELLSPEIPVALPAFRDSLHGKNDPQAYRGYIDVSFVVGKYGTPRNIDILDSSAGTGKTLEKKLRAYIARHRFRPRFVDGNLVRADRVAVRYYYR